MRGFQGTDPDERVTRDNSFFAQVAVQRFDRRDFAVYAPGAEIFGPGQVHDPAAQVIALGERGVERAEDVRLLFGSRGGGYPTAKKNELTDVVAIGAYRQFGISFL